MASKRILFLDHVGVCGGAELSLLDIALAHRDHGQVALFADGPFRRRLEQANVPVTVLEAGEALASIRQASGALRGLQAVPAIAALVRRVARLGREADVLYANSQKAFVVAALAGKLARRPAVWALRDILTAEMFSPANRRVVVTLANRFAARVLANSQATADAFVRSGGRRDLVRVLHNGIDPTPYLHAAAPDHPLPGQGMCRVGVFGRIAPWKGQHVLLDALEHAPNVHALVVGDALFGETEYRDRIQQQARSRGLADRISFLGFRSDIPALMHAVDIVAHTSVEPEPFGRVIVEGMLAGRPVIATDAGGAPEILGHDNDRGLLVPPNNPRALAAAIHSLHDAPDHAAALAARGREHALAHFTLDRMLQAFGRELDDLLAPRKGHAIKQNPSDTRTRPLPADT